MWSLLKSVESASYPIHQQSIKFLAISSEATVSSLTNSHASRRAKGCHIAMQDTLGMKQFSVEMYYTNQKHEALASEGSLLEVPAAVRVHVEECKQLKQVAGAWVGP